MPTKLWKPGQSGNPKGRPKGFRHQDFFDSIIKDHRADLLNLAIEKAKAGNDMMHKFILERFIPKVPLSVKEYEKLSLECEKLRAELFVLKEAPELLEILKEDPTVKERLKARMLNKKMYTEDCDNDEAEDETVIESDSDYLKVGGTD